MSEDKLRYGICGKGVRYHLVVDPRPNWPMSVCWLAMDETDNSPDAYYGLTECKNCRAELERQGQRAVRDAGRGKRKERRRA